MCAAGSGRVWLTGLELDPPAPGLSVSAVGVVPVGRETAMGMTARRRLADLPQAGDLVAGNVVDELCSQRGASAVVSVELHKTRPGIVQTDRLRFVYTVAGEPGQTAWVPHGFRLGGPGQTAG